MNPAIVVVALATAVAAKAAAGSMPRVVPVPDGYRRLKPAEVGPEELAFAKQCVKRVGKPGNQQRATIGGREVLALTEWHYHEPGGALKPWGWHRGISLFTPRA
jgi:hypothetical protein